CRSGAESHKPATSGGRSSRWRLIPSGVNRDRVGVSRFVIVGVEWFPNRRQRRGVLSTAGATG
ncbi:MAG TPA: hypothetical protein VJX28_08435, partial [Chthoniobacterales bacterium]|nr:hypothetical protein [Chthoniobacterales bacterium]